MSQRSSAVTGQRFSLALACRIWKVPRSTVYAFRSRAEAELSIPRRRGPIGPCTDEELVVQIRAVLAASPFHGEGYRKVWARLRAAGTRTSRGRVLRLMREHGLLAPHHPRVERGNKAHDGRITTDRPDEMWGTDATSALTQEGPAFVFIVVDHCTAECLGIHASASGSRHEALEPVRQAVRRVYGSYGQGAGTGLALRHDHGSQYTSRDFQRELRFLGIRSTASYVAEPECNGVVERFIRTLKEQLLWVRSFDSIEALRQALHAFKTTYNSQWLVQKHGYVSPNQARQQLTYAAAA